MKRELRARLERAGPIRVIPRVPSGSPGEVTLRVAGDLAAVDTIAATRALVRRHVEIGRAKAAVEAMVSAGRSTLAVPAIEAGRGLADDLLAAGVTAEVVIEAAHGQ